MLQKLGDRDVVCSLSLFWSLVVEASHVSSIVVALWVVDSLVSSMMAAVVLSRPVVMVEATHMATLVALVLHLMLVMEASKVCW